MAPPVALEDDLLSAPVCVMMPRVETEPEGPYSVCSECGRRADPENPDVVRAFEHKVVRAFGASTKRIDGMPVLLHRGCVPRSGDRYRLDTA